MRSPAHMILGGLALACGSPPLELPPSPPIAPLPSAAELDETPPARATTAEEPACASDADCGYDPERARCLADPRANKQPLLCDQGIVCYCGDPDHRCATLRVPPVPCESDASCAVRADPRPHPVAADAAHPHERGRPCRDFTIGTTCERTNICTLRRHACEKR
jgi:hypothetical protein